MRWVQRQITLKPRPRGFHIVTREIIDQVPELGEIRTGLAYVFIQHTSASLTINENASPDVRGDLERAMNHLIPEQTSFFQHTLEGTDDMPAHIKASLFGSGLLIPIHNGRLRLGTWQGIYLGEHRDDGGPRQIIVTLFGEPAQNP